MFLQVLSRWNIVELAALEIDNYFWEMRLVECLAHVCLVIRPKYPPLLITIEI
jgi:hypothetical protein